MINESLHNGYKKAAQSLGAITGQQVEIEASKIVVSATKEELLDKLSGTPFSVALRTNIIGEANGTSLLLITDVEKSVITKLSLKSFGGDDSIDPSLILLEIDNIISAAVITEISNTFKISIYGDVPQLIEINSKDGLEQIFSESANEVYLLLHAHFVFPNNAEISPAFIWKIDKKIIDRAQSIKQDQV